MNLFNNLRFSPSVNKVKPKLPRAFRQRTFLSGLLLATLSGCGITDLSTGIMADGSEFKGIAVADDPHATLAGKEVLRMGGNAFDAGTTMAFIMAVTLPSRAGIGSSGVCMAYNPETKTEEVLNFIYQGDNADYAVPAMPRAMMALHAKGGKWRWESVLLPAEKIAKQGFVVSKTLETDGQKLPEKFKNKNGNPLKEGDTLIQHDLASTLALLRSRGVAGLYTEAGAKRLIEIAKQENVAFSAQELRDFVPKWEAPKEDSLGNETIYFLSENITSANPSALWGEDQNTEEVKTKAEKSRPEGAGFAVVDADGKAVVCNFSMGGLFGTGKKLSGTGIILGRPLKAPLDDLALMLVVNNNVNEFRYAGYASSYNSTKDMLKTATEAIKEKKPLSAGEATEKNMNIPENSGAIFCSEGLPAKPESCTFITDKRASGYGYRVGGI